MFVVGMAMNKSDRWGKLNIINELRKKVVRESQISQPEVSTLHSPEVATKRTRWMPAAFQKRDEGRANLRYPSVR